MPRSGPVGTYSLPGAQKTQVPDTPIPSAVNNQGYADIEQTFNTPTPIAYGGTNAGTAVGGADNLSTSASIASASTTDLANVTGVNVTVTGTTTITSLGSAQVGAKRWVTFSGILTLTHNGTSLILPTASNIVTAAGDTALFQSLGSGNWICINYQRASGAPLVINNSVALNGSVVGSSYSSYTNNTDITPNIPFDDTAPRWDEGVAVLSVQITPQSTTNKVRIRFMGEVSVSVLGVATAALFVNQSGAASTAVRTVFVTIPTGGYGGVLAMEYEYTPGSLTTQVIDIRVGANTGILRMNGNTSGRVYGGTMGATLTAEEIKA